MKLFKQVFAICLYLTFFFLAGYWVGKNPAFYQELVALGNATPRVYLAHKDLFPASLLEKLNALSHIEFKIVSENPESADLWILPHSQLKTFTELSLRYHLLQNKTISPDFKLAELMQFKALPLGWKILENKMSILVVAAPIQNSRKQTRIVQMLIQALFSKDFQLEMLKNSDWNTTLLTLDESNISSERKASAIRKQRLPNISTE